VPVTREESLCSGSCSAVVERRTRKKKFQEKTQDFGELKRLAFNCSLGGILSKQMRYKKKSRYAAIRDQKLTPALMSKRTRVRPGLKKGLFGCAKRWGEPPFLKLFEKLRGWASVSFWKSSRATLKSIMHPPPIGRDPALDKGVVKLAKNRDGYRFRVEEIKAVGASYETAALFYRGK